jgi:hypothetical protein
LPRRCAPVPAAARHHEVGMRSRAIGSAGAAGLSGAAVAPGQASNRGDRGCRVGTRRAPRLGATTRRRPGRCPGHRPDRRAARPPTPSSATRGRLGTLGALLARSAPSGLAPTAPPLRRARAWGAGRPGPAGPRTGAAAPAVRSGTIRATAGAHRRAAAAAWEARAPRPAPRPPGRRDRAAVAPGGAA